MEERDNHLKRCCDEDISKNFSLRCITFFHFIFSQQFGSRDISFVLPIHSLAFCFSVMAPKKQTNNGKGNGKGGYNGGNGDESPRPTPGAASSTDPIFNPLGDMDEASLNALASAFAGLVLEEQFKVAETFEDTYNTLMARKKMILSTKQVNIKIEAAKNKSKKKDTKKEKSERYQKIQITITCVLRVNEVDKRFTMQVYTSDRIGSLRSALANAMGVRKNMHMTFQTLDGNPMPKHSATTYLYTLGVRDGSVINFVLGSATATNAVENNNNNADDGAGDDGADEDEESEDETENADDPEVAEDA